MLWLKKIKKTSRFIKINKMCKQTSYAIFDMTPRVRAVTESYNELNQIMTGLGLDREDYVCPIISKEDAEKLKRELSNRAKNLSNTLID